MNPNNKNIIKMEHTSGSVGGIIGVVFANVIGAITFSGALETAIYALIGGVVGYFAVKGIKWIEKKCKGK